MGRGTLAGGPVTPQLVRGQEGLAAWLTGPVLRVNLQPPDSGTEWG